MDPVTVLVGGLALLYTLAMAAVVVLGPLFIGFALFCLAVYGPVCATAKRRAANN